MADDHSGLKVEEAQATAVDDGVVGDDPVCEFPVEEVEVGKEPILVLIDERLLDRVIETLNMGIHLGALRIGPVVGQPHAPDGLIEDPLEL